MSCSPNRILLQIEGMHCEGCVRRVRKLLEVAGAAEVQEIAIGSASVVVHPGGPTLAALTSVLQNAGFGASGRSEPFPELAS